MKKSDLLTFGRRLHDIGRVVVEAVHEAGGTDEDAAHIFSDEFLRKQVAQLVLGKVKLKLFPSQIHAPKLIPKDWEVVKGKDVEPTEFEVKDLEFISFLEDGESSVKGEVMRQRAVTLKANLGLSDGKFLLDHQDEIPAELRDKYIVLTGTVLRDPDGRLHVPYLRWLGDGWFLLFDWLDRDWHDRGRLARRK